MTGNIILGGDGGDIIEGRGGDDLIDGDTGSTCASACGQMRTALVAEIASFDSMTQMFKLMIDGIYNPGQLVAVREIKLAPTAGFDTAVFSGNFKRLHHQPDTATVPSPLPTMSPTAMASTA